jgi:hypothetical protein
VQASAQKWGVATACWNDVFCRLAMKHALGNVAPGKMWTPGPCRLPTMEVIRQLGPQVGEPAGRCTRWDAVHSARLHLYVVALSGGKLAAKLVVLHRPPACRSPLIFRHVPCIETCRMQ